MQHYNEYDPYDEFVERVYRNQILLDNIAHNPTYNGTRSFTIECLKIVVPSAAIFIAVFWLIN